MDGVGCERPELQRILISFIDYGIFNTPLSKALNLLVPAQQLMFRTQNMSKFTWIKTVENYHKAVIAHFSQRAGLAWSIEASIQFTLYHKDTF